MECMQGNAVKAFNQQLKRVGVKALPNPVAGRSTYRRHYNCLCTAYYWEVDMQKLFTHTVASQKDSVVSISWNRAAVFDEPGPAFTYNYKCKALKPSSDSQ
jgi:hypothetical protein